MNSLQMHGEDERIEFSMIKTQKRQNGIVSCAGNKYS